MNNKSIPGKISFIHHEKNRAVIEYTDNGKKKTIQADISETEQKRLKKLKIIKKIHRFLIGDQVNFVLKKTGSNGSQQYASEIQYQYNTALELLINKAKIENKFLGYIKVTEGQYFIKEIESYLFFPLSISPYEIAPTENEDSEPITFKFENIENTDKLTTSLFNHQYIPEFLTAVQHFKKQTIVEAVVFKISSFGIHVNLVGNKIQGKLAIDEMLAEEIQNKSIQLNTVIPVKIKHFSATKVVLEKVSEKE